jgi:hypothetical protein
MYGLSYLRVAEYISPNISTQRPEEVRERAETFIDNVIKPLTYSSPKQNEHSNKRGNTNAKNLIFAGNLEEINEFFYKRKWTDGLPVIPPTLEAVEKMTKFASHRPDECLGVLQPAHGRADVWKVAVNGVMAGCRPQYMPILETIIGAIADPRFNLQHAGSTEGWTPVIVLNGPIIKELDFNSGQGVLRPDRRANITIARFLRLVLVNMAGFKVGTTDMASFGHNYLPVLAEAEEESPFEPFSADRGFKRGDNVLTVFSMGKMSDQFVSYGTAEEQLKKITNEMISELGAGYLGITAYFGPEVLPLLCLSPLVASILAKAGYSKSDLKQYFFDNARVPAFRYEEEISVWPDFDIHRAVKEGKLPASFVASERPTRMLPILRSPEQLQIVVSGPTTRNRNFIIAQIGDQGLTTSKEIKLPPNWNDMLKYLTK